MADGWTEAGVMKDLGARNHQLNWSSKAPRCYGHQHRLHLHRVFLAEAASDIRRDDLDAVRRQTQRRDQAMAEAFCVLSALVHYELALLPLCDRGDQLHWVMGLEALKGMASGHQKAARLQRPKIFVCEDQPNAGHGAGGPSVDTDNAPFRYCCNSERCVENVRSRIVGAKQNRTAYLIIGIDAWSIRERRVAHRRTALCFAIDNA